jgi:molybdenum-dependent DNA-binding transcriptional regulator ModE
MPAPRLRIDPNLFQFCTVRQLEILEAVNEHKSQRAAARVLGVNKSRVEQALFDVERKAAIHGYAPQHDLTHTVAPGQKLKGASTLYKEGKAVLQWVKTSADEHQREQIMREAVRALSEDCKGLSPMIPAPEDCAADLLAVYPLGDPHFGMYAWAKEAGDDFDLNIARALTLGAVDRLVQAAPPAKTAILLPLGDVFHMDDQSNQTPAHRHQLDADGRFVKVLQVGIHTFRHAVLRCLEKHEQVIVRFVSGNHDPHAVWALAYSIAAYFDTDPRVTVDLSPSKHWFYRFGSVLIGATHGDTTKHKELLGVMAADRPEDWGATKHRYFYTGHVHSQNVTELPGLVCESFRTLAAKDAYAAGAGYRAGRDMRLIVMHSKHGEIERHRCDVGMVA